MRNNILVEPLISQYFLPDAVLVTWHYKGNYGKVTSVIRISKSCGQSKRISCLHFRFKFVCLVFQLTKYFNHPSALSIFYAQQYSSWAFNISILLTWCSFSDMRTPGATIFRNRSMSANTHSSLASVIRKSPLNRACRPYKNDSRLVEKWEAVK